MIALISHALAATIDTSLPGPFAPSTYGPVAIIGNIYSFALGIGGLLAFGSIVYAGIKRAASRGNPAAISDANDQMTQAALGLLMLMGSYIILNTINPQLTILQIPKLESVSSTAAGGVGGANANSGYCTKEHFGACVLGGGSITQSCELQDDGTYACVTRDEAMWACYNSSGLLKACYPVGSSEIGHNLPKKSQCDTWCQQAYKKDCVASIKPKSGCKIQ